MIFFFLATCIYIRKNRYKNVYLDQCSDEKCLSRSSSTHFYKSRQVEVIKKDKKKKRHREIQHNMIRGDEIFLLFFFFFFLVTRYRYLYLHIRLNFTILWSIYLFIDLSFFVDGHFDWRSSLKSLCLFSSSSLLLLLLSLLLMTSSRAKRSLMNTQ